MSEPRLLEIDNHTPSSTYSFFITSTNSTELKSRVRPFPPSSFPLSSSRPYHSQLSAKLDVNFLFFIISFLVSTVISLLQHCYHTSSLSTSLNSPLLRLSLYFQASSEGCRFQDAEVFHFFKNKNTAVLLYFQRIFQK